MAPADILLWEDSKCRGVIFYFALCDFGVIGGSSGDLQPNQKYKTKQTIIYFNIYIRTGGIMEIYVVKENDTVDDIADRFGIGVESVIYDNQLVYPYELAVGQALLIDNGGIREDKRSGVFRGFAYPFISKYVLNETLPSLSELAVFSYGFTGEGNLIYPKLDDEFMIEAAKNYRALPILTLTPFDESGRFSNELISEVINNGQAVTNLINQLVDIMTNKGFEGIDIDFEYIKAEDREAFVEFVRQVTLAMHEVGVTVSVDLAPKTSADQPGLLYEGKDYRALGEIADSVLVMTYEWGYTYGPPMAVAPINKVRQVLDYAVTEISPEKINMGIPNYGYDWPLPFVQGTTKAKTIGNVEAVRIAIENNVVIEFDKTAMSPYLRYVDNGVEHEVWFEDARSIQAKLELIYEYNLRGASYWQIMQLFINNWLLTDYNFSVVKNEI